MPTFCPWHFLILGALDTRSLWNSFNMKSAKIIVNVLILIVLLIQHLHNNQIIY